MSRCVDEGLFFKNLLRASFSIQNYILQLENAIASEPLQKLSSGFFIANCLGCVAISFLIRRKRKIPLGNKPRMIFF